MNPLKESRNKPVLKSNSCTHKESLNIPHNIERKIILYYGPSTSLSTFNQCTLKDIVVSCVKSINKESVHNAQGINAEQLCSLIITQNTDEDEFRLINKNDWCSLLKKRKICSMGRAIELWTKIHSSHFRSTNI